MFTAIIDLTSSSFLSEIKEAGLAFSRTAITCLTTWGHYNLYLECSIPSCPSLQHYETSPSHWRNVYTCLYLRRHADAKHNISVRKINSMHVRFLALAWLVLGAIHLLTATWSWGPRMNGGKVASEDEARGKIFPWWPAAAWPLTLNSGYLGDAEMERTPCWRRACFH